MDANSPIKEAAQDPFAVKPISISDNSLPMKEPAFGSNANNGSDAAPAVIKPAQAAWPTYQSYAPEPASGRSPAFFIFAILVIGAAAIAGSVKSGKLNLSKYFNVPKPALQAVVSTITPVTSPAPVTPLKADAFVVTGISLGQPSFAIINGVSHREGDSVEAPGVTGWTVRHIVDGTVWLQNGSTFASVPLTLPGIKPLNDQLHPLN